MDQTSQIINALLESSSSLRGEMCKGLFGLEKEGLRVDNDGNISTRIHPKILGSKATHPFITTDFAEAQPELITPPMESIEEMLGFVETLTSILQDSLPDELIWPNSLPPEGDYKDVAIADFGPLDSDKSKYRHYLNDKYGKQRMLMSGIHFNYSLPHALLQGLSKEEREASYLKIFRNFFRYRWVLIWLYGTSPYAKKQKHDILGVETTPCQGSASYRNSTAGYKNTDAFYISYEGVADYIKQVDNLVKEGHLYSAAELYTPIRLKLNDKGEVNHLEIRLFDLFPLHHTHINAQALYFCQQLLLYCLMKDEAQPCLSPEEQDISNYNSDKASCCGQGNVELLDWAGNSLDSQKALINLLAEVKSLTQGFGFEHNESYARAMQEAEMFVKSPHLRPLISIKKGMDTEGFMNYNLSLARQHRNSLQEKKYLFKGFEDLELSTQLLLRIAVKKGLSFEILDRSENFVRLSYQGHVEDVVQATKTRLDNYVAILKMENKVVTKKLLYQAGLSVPMGREFDELYTASSYFSSISGQATVVKPKSTNFGLGISILKENTDPKHYEKALAWAFEHDHTVLIEPFISGKEYRFFVIDDQVCGVLHRVPANVEGDGVSTIQMLVDKKNSNPLRGKGYHTPLEKIALGHSEALFLEMQGLHFESILPQGERVYLRENSNISTGGDSLDFTDEMHASYKEIAIEAAQVLGVRITGLDMMIDDLTQPAQSNNYAIIEMNFNPALHIHCYPFQGQNRNIDEKIINILFPELQ